jgi:hypothetical protein
LLLVAAVHRLTQTFPLLLTLAACSVATPEDAVCSGADLAPELCSAISDPATSAKADSPALRGIIVERIGDRIIFKIPLAHTFEADRRRLLDEAIDQFSGSVTYVSNAMSERGVDLSRVADLASGEGFRGEFRGTFDRFLDTDAEDEIDILVGDEGEPRELWTWQRYVTPQAFVGYFGTKFTANLGIGGGISATVLIVVQPWLALEVDYGEDEPTIVDKSYLVDVAILGVPNIDVGFGAGGGVPVRIGAGAVFGPLDRPEDLAGWGVGLSGSFALPIAGGGQAKFISVLKDPPLFLALAGYNTGTAAGAEIHGNLQYIMDLDEFLSWITSFNDED